MKTTTQQQVSIEEKLEYQVDMEKRVLTIPVLSRVNLLKIVSDITTKTKISAFDLSEFTVNIVK